jgi:hypothetical protein
MPFRPTKAQWLRYQFPIAVLVLVVGTALSWRGYPGNFDWRYQVVCSLISQVVSPAAYIYLCVALLISFSLLLPLPTYLRERLRGTSPRTARAGAWLLWTGFAGAVGVAMEKLFIRNLSSIHPRGHEYIALVAFLGMFFGVALFWFALVGWARQHRGWSFARMAALFLLSIGPILGAALSQGYLYYVPNDLGWVGPHWAALGVPVWYSCAFWEWVATACIFVYLYCLIYLLPADVRNSTTSPKLH